MALIDDIDVTNEQARLIDETCAKAQRAAEAHLEACEERRFLEDECGADLQALEALGEPPYFGGGYCGCLTCQVRETLHAAWDHLEEVVLIEWGIARSQGKV